MATTLFTAAIVCIIAALIGGGVKGFGIEFPTLNDEKRKIVAGLGLLLAIGAYFVPSEKSTPIPPPQPTFVSPPAPPPPPPRYLAFSNEITLSERGTSDKNGVMIRTGYIRQETGIVVEISAKYRNGFETSAVMRTGDVMELSERICEYLRVHATHVALELPDGITWEQVRRMGMMAEAVVKRVAKFQVSGRCQE
jgi:hypothetical protein